MTPLTSQRKVSGLPLLWGPAAGPSCCQPGKPGQPWGVTGANLCGEPRACISEPFPGGSSVAGTAELPAGESRTARVLWPRAPPAAALTHRQGGAPGEACGSRGGLFTAPETRGLLFQACLSVWECGPCPAPGAGAPWGAGLAEAPC